MRRAGIAGEVIVSFRVREDGSVDDVTVVRSSQKEFEQAAMECIAQWKFKPALLAGKPVATYLQLPFTFTLNEQ
jgi:protein TonB